MGKSGLSLIDLLLFPVAFPFKELLFLADEIGKMAERELADPEFLQKRLVELQLRREMGEIAESDYLREWGVLTARLRSLNEGRPGAGGARGNGGAAGVVTPRPGAGGARKKEVGGVALETARKAAAKSNREKHTIIDAADCHYRDLNERIHRAAAQGALHLDLHNVNGQRYIAGGLRARTAITIQGTAGNDLGVFMDGPEIEVHGNAQDGAGNTMNSGRIVIHGDAGQIVGLSMRGGRIYVRGNAGYRSGIHMKGYEDKIPVIVIGGAAGAFLGEYMAGGRIYVLGLDNREPAAGENQVWSPRKGAGLVGSYTGTGMHGGVIYIRGGVDEARLGKEVVTAPAGEEDRELMAVDLRDFAGCFGLDAEAILASPFTRLTPRSHRPYGKFYAY